MKPESTPQGIRSEPGPASPYLAAALVLAAGVALTLALWSRTASLPQAPDIVLIAGTLFSLLFAALALYFCLARANARALRRAAGIADELKQSEQRIRALAALSSDWFWHQDEQARFTDVSGGPWGEMPLPFDRVRGKTRWELAPDALTAEQWEAHRRKLAAREPFELEYALPMEDGVRRWLLVRGAPRYAGSGAFLGFQGTTQDITKRKRAEEALNERTAVLKATLENMAQGISVVDGDLRLVAYNRHFLELLGFPDSLIREDTSFEDFIRYNAERGEYGPGNVDELVRGRVELARRFAPHRLKRVRPDGTVLEIVGTPMPGGGFVTTYTDITEQERAADGLRVANETLEQRVRGRTAELEASNRELESFSYSVSHDLRAPLRALDGFSHLLEDEFSDRLNDEGRSYLKRIRSASQRMGTLIDDLLDLARVSRQELNRAPIDLSTLAAEICATLREEVPDRKVALRISPELRACADPVLMKLALDNLLRNAWKFTAERGEACIEFGAMDAGSERGFFVRDDGVGFDAAYAGKLFKPFQRLHDPKRFEGTGIGLAIVQRIVSRHGGRVWAESRPEQGAIFRFTLG